ISPAQRPPPRCTPFPYTTLFRSQAGSRSVVCEVVEHDLPARAIAEQAEHYDADLVCVGTLGRSGLSAALLGSTAQDVLKQLRRRSEEHTSELQSRENLVCRLLLE